MFVFDMPHQPHTDPWGAPFEERFRALCAGSPRVAYFYERPDCSTFRYRVYNMIQVLRSFGEGLGAAYFCYEDVDQLNRVVDNADVIVICRARYNQHLDQMVTRAKAQGKKVLFDVDDLVFDLSYAHLILRTLDVDISGPHAAWDHWFGWIGRIGQTYRMCDGAITTNSYLGERLREFHDVPVAVVPNFLNREQLAVSNLIFEEKLRRRFQRTSEIHIGYFSGSPTHNRDIAMISEDLAESISRHDNVRLRVTGYMEPKGGLRQLADRIEFHPMYDFVNLQRLMGLVEINIVPLQDNVFTNCKSELKYFEAAAVGTITVASPTHTYSAAIRDGENGFLARSTQWTEQIERAIAMVNDYDSMAVAAREAALEGYAWYHQYHAIEAALFRTADQATIAPNIIFAENPIGLEQA